MKRAIKIILFVLVAIVIICTAVLLIDNKKVIAPTEQSIQGELNN